jgi:hypothetical protein
LDGAGFPEHVQALEEDHLHATRCVEAHGDHGDDAWMPKKAVKEWDLMIDDMLEGNKTDDNAYTFYDVGEVWEALVGEFPDFGKEELIKPYAAAMTGHDITKLHEVPNALRDRVDSLLSQNQVCVVFWIAAGIVHVFSLCPSQQGPSFKVKDDDAECFTAKLGERALTIVWAEAARLAQVIPKTDIGLHLKLLR